MTQEEDKDSGEEEDEPEEDEPEEEEPEEVISVELVGDGSPSGVSTDVDSEEMELGNGCGSEEEIEEYDRREMSHEMAFSLHKRLSCFTHTLQLVVCKFDTIMSPKQVIQSARRIVNKFNESVKATEKLIALCGKKLVSACPTRWNSTFLIISCLLEVRPYLATVLQQLKLDNLAHSEWKILENLYVLLKQFARYTAQTSLMPRSS